MSGAGFSRSAHYLWAADPVLSVLALLGLVFGARAYLARPRGERRAPEVLVVAAFGLAYLAAIGMYYSTWPRFLTPLT